MPNSIKYNTSAETLALKKGNFWIGTNDVSKGNTPTSGYWNGITPPAGGYTIYLNKATQGPAIFVANNDAELISITNRIASTNYSTVTACLSWFATRTDKMVLNRNYEPIITNGLVLNLDVSFVSSYPRTGTTWYNTGSNTSDLTMINGPTFNNSGFMIFDGSNDYGSIPSSINWALSTSSTVNVWCNPTSGSGWIVAFDKGSWNGWFININTFLYNGQAGSDQNTTLNGSYNVWQLFTAVVDRESGFYKTYKNGVFVAQTAITHPPLGYSGNLFLSSRGLVPDNFYNGKTSAVQLYNRSLSVSEILQNYYKGPIVTSGLVFAVDAGNIVSYEPGSTTAYDLTGNVTAGTLNNGTYGSGNWFIFDGSNDEISFPHDADYKNQSLSVDFWVNLDSESSGRHVMFTTWYGFTVEVNNPGGSLSWGLNGLPGQYMTAGTITYGSTTHIACTYNTTTNVQNIYINGSLAGTQVVDGTINYSSDNLYFSGSWDRTKGKMGSMKVYNKDLSSTEVSQNYNAQKVRFGL